MQAFETELDGVRVLAREVRPEDLDALVAYWHESSPDYLASLGVDPAKLGSREETRARLSPSGEPGRRSVTVVAEVDGELVAYTNMRVVEPGTACAHLHTLRRDRLVRRVVYALFPQVTVAAASDLGVVRLRFETTVGNDGINRYLQRFGLEPRRRWLDDPDGLARAGEFNVYELTLGAAHEEDHDRARRETSEHA
jgi:RimJ/RimL family protein N-acetyltransferase